jgi:predicted nucleic acid-binding protein
MIVVSDTSPLSALASIHRLDLLAELYSEITVPTAVLAECLHQGAPEVLRQWAMTPPPWVHVASPQNEPTHDLEILDPGETEAILIALDAQGPVLLLMDERDGVKAAERLGIPFVGTLGLLVKAHLVGLIDFESVLETLRATSIRLSEAVILRAREIVAKNDTR